MTLRYGLRRLLDDQDLGRVEMITRSVRELLERAVRESPNLDWQTLSLSIYREAGDTGPLIVDVEIEEERP